MKIWKYKDYEEYRDKQTEANKVKIKNVWVSRSTIRQIYELHGSADRIICHGTRNAAEQRLFKEFYSQAYIIGTEISDTAASFEMTVEWDFHEQNDHWKNHFDIVYTNSLDHAIDPMKALTTWKNQLSSSGRLYIEYYFLVKSREWDPFETDREELIGLFETAGLTNIESFTSKSSTGCISETFVCKNASF